MSTSNALAGRRRWAPRQVVKEQQQLWVLKDLEPQSSWAWKYKRRRNLDAREAQSWKEAGFTWKTRGHTKCELPPSPPLVPPAILSPRGSNPDRFHASAFLPAAGSTSSPAKWRSALFQSRRFSRFYSRRFSLFYSRRFSLIKHWQCTSALI